MYRRVTDRSSFTTQTYGPRTSCSTAVTGIAGRFTPVVVDSVTDTVPPAASMRFSLSKQA